MKIHYAIPHGNHRFYEEFKRAKNMTEVNESAGLKHLAQDTIFHAKQALAQELINRATVEFVTTPYGIEVVVEVRA